MYSEMLTKLVFFNLLFNCIALEATMNYDNIIPDLSGAVASVFTPFVNDSTYKINYSVIPRFAQHLYANNIENIIVGGIMGEGSQLTLCERKVLYKAWVDVAKPLNITVITEVAAMSSTEVFELVKHCVKIGVDILIALPPLIYIPQSPQELVTALLLLYDLSPGLPWLYYDIPSLTGVKLDMVEFFELATEQIPNFIGIVCDQRTAVQVHSRIELKNGQQLLVRESNFIKKASDLGLSSITASASIYPDLVTKIQNTTDKSAAAKAQAYLNKVNSPVLTQRNKLSLFKDVFTMVTGINVGPTRQPIVGTTYNQRRHVSSQLQAFGVDLKMPVI